MAARTNCHESGALKQQTFISLTVLEAESTESSSWQNHALSADSREEPLLPLPASAVAGNAWLAAASR